jgi:hypothetical protein
MGFAFGQARPGEALHGPRTCFVCFAVGGTNSVFFFFFFDNYRTAAEWATSVLFGCYLLYAFFGLTFPRARMCLESGSLLLVPP